MTRLPKILLAMFFLVKWTEVSTATFMAEERVSEFGRRWRPLPEVQRMSAEERFDNFREANNFYHQFTAEERRALGVTMTKRSECESVKEVQIKPQEEKSR